MARSRQNTSSQAQQTSQSTPVQNWWDRLLVHIGSTGGAFIVLITIGGASFEAGRRYMENEKNIEIFDLKTEHKSKLDSLILKNQLELNNWKNKSQKKNGKR